MSRKNTVYLSIGIDVGSDFSLMAAALPTQELYGKTYRILHSSQRSVNGAIDRIKSLMKQFDLPVRIFMESTGIYHLPLYHRFKKAGFDTYILNPLVTHANKDINVRNIHHDRFDAKKIALLGLRPDLKTSIVPDEDIAAVKVILREYYALKKELSMYICRLKCQLRQAFPQFIPIFSKVNGTASMAVLYEYLTPDAILAAGEQELAVFLKSVVHKGPLDIQKKAKALVEAAIEAQEFGHGHAGIFYLIRHYIDMIRILDKQAKQLLEQVKSMINDQNSSKLAQQVRLLESIPGIGFLSAVTLVCEIGDFSAFKRPKQLFAYFGLDPIVDQSSYSNAANLKMSKRGSPYARRCIYVLAIQSISHRADGTPKNPVLRNYYDEKCRTKTKMTALGAIMHKVCNIIYAVLRDERPFVLTAPEEHRAKFFEQKKKTA